MAHSSSIFQHLAEFPQWSLLNRKIKVKQHYKYDCGAACLASIAAYYGICTSLARIRMVCGCTPEGISIQGIVDGATRLGLRAKGLLSKEKDTGRLTGLQHPFIAHITENGGYLHYIAVYAVTGKYVKAMDPADGKFVRMDPDEFQKKWSGYIITIAPDNGIQTGEVKEGYWELLSKLAGKNARELAIAFSATAICMAASISTTFLLQQIIDNIVPQRDSALMWAVCTVMPLLMFLSLYLGYIAAKHIIRCSIQMEGSLVASYIEKIFSLPLRFFESYTPGDISSRRDDIRMIRDFITGNVIGIGTSAIAVAGSLVIMTFYNTRLAGVTAIFIPLYWILHKISYRMNGRYSREIAVSNSSFESSLLNGIAASASMRHYNAMELVTDKIASAHIGLMEKLQRSADTINLLQTLVQGTSKTLLCIIVISGSYAVLDGEMTLGELVGFYSLCSFFTVPVNDLIEGSTSMAKAKVACERISEILSLNEDEGRSGKLDPATLDGNIQIRGLHFRHPGKAPLFSGFNATLESGCINMVEGESGCGKSTLMHLIMGDYVPDKGEISYGGIALEKFDKNRWRDMIGYVEQRPHMLNATILENITLTDRNPDTGRVLEICRGLKMDKMLMEFPQGLLTEVGSNGEGLSGGECQKICIARALYKGASIFIFDEATSALDRHSAGCVVECIRKLREKGKTIICISHKKEENLTADNVVSI